MSPLAVTLCVLAGALVAPGAYWLVVKFHRGEGDPADKWGDVVWLGGLYQLGFLATADTYPPHVAFVLGFVPILLFAVANALILTPLVEAAAYLSVRWRERGWR